MARPSLWVQYFTIIVFCKLCRSNRESLGSHWGEGKPNAGWTSKQRCGFEIRPGEKVVVQRVISLRQSVGSPVVQVHTHVVVRTACIPWGSVYYATSGLFCTKNPIESTLFYINKAQCYLIVPKWLGQHPGTFMKGPSAFWFSDSTSV